MTGHVDCAVSPEIVDAAAELVERSCAAQNLPLVVEDDAVLRKIATIARDHDATGRRAS